MGTTCSCRDGCGSNDTASGPPAPSEYEPRRGACEEENPDVCGEEFCREQKKTQAAMASAADGGPAGLENVLAEAAGRLEALAENTDGKFAGAVEEPASPTKLDDNVASARDGTQKVVDEADANALKAAAFRNLHKALSANLQNLPRIELAIKEGEKACVDTEELDKARKHLERVSAIVGMHKAAADGDARSMQEAVSKAQGLGGVPEAQLAKARTSLKRVEEERQQVEQKQIDEAAKRHALQNKQEASSALRTAVAGTDAEQLRSAIVEAELRAVPLQDLTSAREALAALEKKKKGCLCCGGKKKRSP